MKIENYTCDILLSGGGCKQCGKKVAMRRMRSGEQCEFPIGISVGNCFYNVCESCAQLPLTELLKRIIGHLRPWHRPRIMPVILIQHLVFVGLLVAKARISEF
jgi:hypothetical protein